MSMPIPISTYTDYLDMIPVKKMRELLRETDHDCRLPYDACTTCWIAVDGTDDEVRDEFTKAVQAKVIEI